MLRALIPVLLMILGLGGGVGAGVVLRPAPAPDPGAAHGDCVPGESLADGVPVPEPDAGTGAADREYVKLNNQFVVPVVARERVSALVVMSLSVEIEPGLTEDVYRHEPKLRDSFLQVLFDHANMGGFDGEFTDGGNMAVLRGALTEVARAVIGDAVTGVLITDIARQDG